jgi:DNA-binding CsgD family transcriptional regulator
VKKPVVAYIRQLCCLGLGGQIIMPELLHALHAFIPSASNMFLWADEHYQMSNVYCEDSALLWVQSLYFKEFYNSKEVQVYKIGFSEAMRIGRGWGNSERLGPDFVSSELFNELLRPNGVRYGIEATIWENGRGLGSIVLNRAPGEKPFSNADEMNLRSLIPYIAHGLRGTRDLRGELTPSGESGTVIVDSHDQIVQFCPEGKRLLLLASHPGRTMHDAPGLDSPALQRLSANLRGILRGRPQPVPMLRQQNALGEFVFRAYPLGTHGEADGSIAVVIERHEPLPLKLMRNMNTLPLTARQREVCLLLSYGHSHNMIAQRMHVSKHTATDYVRKIYDKLDVNGHDQLMKKLESITVH